MDISEMLPSSDGKLSSFKEKNQEKCDENLWIKVNVEQSGFYRVKYDDELTARLMKAVENNCLSATDKLGLLDDMLALCEACKQSFSSLLLLMDAHRQEHNSMVLSKLINVCYNVVKIATDAIPDFLNELKIFCISLLQCCAQKLGWEPISGESHLNVMLRGEVFMALATFGHDETQREAMARFQTAFFSVMRNASTTNRNGFESLLNLYRKSDAAQEKEQILNTLASSPDPDVVLEVQDQYIVYGLRGISLEGRKTAWIWLKENWERVSTKYGSGFLLYSFIRNIVTPFCSNQKADEVETFFASHVNPGVDRILKQSIKRIRIKARWIESIKQEQSQSQSQSQSLPHLIKQ